MKKIYHKLGLDRFFKKRKICLDVYRKFPKKSLIEKRFYNIGAGRFSHPYWTNVDYATDYYSKSQKNVFINYNIMEKGPLPIEDNTAEIVYSSHTVEHVNDEAAIELFKEINRILKPGGIFRVTCPDALLSYRAYKRNDISYWYWVRSYSKAGKWKNKYNLPLNKAPIGQLFLNQFAGQFSEINTDSISNIKYSDSEINEIFNKLAMDKGLDFFTKKCKFNPDRPGNHINWWTYEKLDSFLRNAGFTTVYKSGYGQSQTSPLRDLNYFDNTKPKISLYVEATK